MHKVIRWVLAALLAFLVIDALIVSYVGLTGRSLIMGGDNLWVLVVPRSQPQVNGRPASNSRVAPIYLTSPPQSGYKPGSISCQPQHMHQVSLGSIQVRFLQCDLGSQMGYP
jgi:hypothetical protein